jgi:hypothetical protein
MTSRVGPYLAFSFGGRRQHRGKEKTTTRLSIFPRAALASERDLDQQRGAVADGAGDLERAAERLDSRTFLVNRLSS